MQTQIRVGPVRRTTWGLGPPDRQKVL